MMNGWSTLGSGNLRDALKLPPGEDRNEWLAVNLIDLVKQVRMLFGVLCESECTDSKCPEMTAKDRVYTWTNDETVLNTSAPQYIDLSLSWCQMNIDDENVFPSEIGKKFPPIFDEICKTIMRRLFRIYAHVYHCHLNHFKEIKALAHLNTSFKQFVLFANQFELLKREETEPLRGVIESLMSSG
ncbi:unnamed protein product [Caenorhabditis angaria]|uniref:Uncharacterized protein n=1 Tax=Caenorhabditis angaria TaxID=860376 RepID=A0A9P1IRI5_9PELO|nr:unnamed protein product [Caenorhabditis angaria]